MNYEDKAMKSDKGSIMSWELAGNRMQSAYKW